ncbi:hypothetical protein DY000_02021138 [Brassica cretica]|uniref:Uncharacterized protein n=1 Tax=Brassica cretica TaxID=69181 RepID=A0ABQ7EJ02_BRACR|nr:hypothetical protein DY000_02021138 [Brassica cretica]
MVSKDTGNTHVPSFLRGYAKVELLTISELIISEPQDIVSVCTGMETDIKMEKNWCYVFCVHKEAPTNGLILFI